MADTLRTARLRLRPWTQSDVGLLSRLSDDPGVVRYIGDGQRWPEERAAETSRLVLEHWSEHGFGWRVMALHETGEEVGFAALNHPGPETGLELSEFEIGWWVAPQFWRQGLASEAAEAVRDDAFARLGAPSVVARLQPDNLASAGVAKRIGLVQERDITGRWGEPVAIYRGGWALA